MTVADERLTETRTRDGELRARAARVIPGGMYGHMLVNEHTMPPSFPQFYDRGEGALTWDVDGNRYIDFLCSFGPMLLGHRNPRVDAAAAAQQALGDTLTGPSARMVELAEVLTGTIAHADWAMFAKNGTDATSMGIRIARAATGKAKFLKAAVAYHGANDWFTPRTAGVTDADRANIVEFEYNDVASLRAAVAAHSGEIAAIIVTPFRHDAFVPQELVDPAFARAAREAATAEGAALLLDEVRTGFRLDVRGAWESLGVRPDLTAFSKALANGYPIAALVGTDALSAAASEVYVTGSFWSSAVPMAAGIATIREAVALDAPALTRSAGARFKAGLEAQSVAAGMPLELTGPEQMPLLVFADDVHKKRAFAFTDAAIRRGVLLHPWHNMFLSTAHTDEVVDEALLRTQDAFDELTQLDV
ncbi:aminotransferase class III-fold pyridoxal phosphate-dependent enzyme [Klenkia taihuensis]|uniref:Glutamate-1-semialdehyde 2,1-aminomutase n=1 Tax=Klenkia taihuensis TaxID=1225127 RepID=A0A1I1H485_9ACTN|nr:aminotransferase class III-fold pyridoxal phosphate-dependent enzyme [Klenkia taihuensis]GHE09412.1 glutamate-1-semialdehyde 2,1-aminomutase [Klenkia taihuensis]SFC18545.1 glutamate-1-semialdehyde 2,1-aminomutase [Klenkia taihuensis]